MRLRWFEHVLRRDRGKKGMELQDKKKKRNPQT